MAGDPKIPMLSPSTNAAKNALAQARERMCNPLIVKKSIPDIPLQKRTALTSSERLGLLDSDD